MGTYAKFSYSYARRVLYAIQPADGGCTLCLSYHLVHLQVLLELNEFKEIILNF